MSKLIPRFCEMFQVREKIRKGPRCILCGDLLSQDFLVDGIHVSAAFSGSTDFSLSGVTVTQLLTMSDSDDDDRRSRREEREEGPPKPEQKKRRRKTSTSQAKPLEESTAADTSKDPEAPAEDLAEAPVPVPTVKQPPVSPDAKPVKGKKGKGKGKGKKGKSKGKDFGSPRSRPGKPSEPLSPPIPSSREILAELQKEGLGDAKEKLRLRKSGFSQGDPKKYRCDFCRKRGRLSRNCPEITFRVSLSEGAVITQKAQEGGGPPESEVLVTTADPETLPDAAIRLVERRAVKANPKEERERLKQHEAEANEILRTERERKDRERKGQEHEVPEKEKKYLAREAKRKITKDKKKVLY